MSVEYLLSTAKQHGEEEKDAAKMFFELENKYASLAAKHDPLLKLNTIIAWENFRDRLKTA